MTTFQVPDSLPKPIAEAAYQRAKRQRRRVFIVEGQSYSFFSTGQFNRWKAGITDAPNSDGGSFVGFMRPDGIFSPA